MSDDPFEETLDTALEADAIAHEAGSYDVVGARCDDLTEQVRPLWESRSDAVARAFFFWDCWIDARNHDWQYYPDAAEADWPRFARAIAAALRDGSAVHSVPESLLATSPTLRQRLRACLRGGPSST